MVSCPLLFPPVNTGSPAAEGGNFPPPWVRRFLRRQTAALSAAEGGNFLFYDGRQFPSLTQVVS